MRWLMKIIGTCFACVLICLLVVCCRYEKLNQKFDEEVKKEVTKMVEPVEDDGIVRQEPKKTKAMKRNVNPDPDTFGTTTEDERKQQQ